MPLIIVQTPVHAGVLGQLLPSSTPVDVPLELGFDLVGRGAAVWVTKPDFEENPPAVPVAGISDASSLTLTSAQANTGRIPAGALTYTINAATAWAVSDGMAVWLPASGAVSFAVSGGPTINGGTSTLTRTLASNALGYVVLNRIAGTDAYSLSGA